MSTDLLEIVELLYGSGTDELVHKMNPDGADISTKKQRERTQARIGLASNVVGIAAGTAGLHEAVGGYKATRYKKRTGKEMPEKKPKTNLGRKFKRIKGKYAVPLAAGAVGLQGANLAGDAIANRVLARSAKEEPNVKGGAPTAIRVANQQGKRAVKATSDQAKKPFGKSKLSETEILNNAKTTTKGALTRAHLPTNRAQAGAYTKRGVMRRLPDSIKTTNHVEKREAASSAEVDVIWEGEFAKTDEDKQQIFGWASVVEVDGQPVVDLQGDYISTDEMEKAGYEYVMKSRKGGDMHLRDEWSPVQASEMIESFIVTPEKRGAMGLPDSVPSGWWVGFQVQDPDVWAKVKSGERTGFSIHGHGRRS